MKYNLDLYKRNLSLLEERQPGLAAKLGALENVVTKVVEDGESGINLDLGHTKFYSEDAETFSRNQLSNYWEDLDRVDVAGAGLGVSKKLREVDSSKTLAERMLLLSRKWMADQGLTGSYKLKDGDAGFLFILGMGLGYHIDSLVETADVLHVVVIEQFAEFLFHCLHIHDLSQWYGAVEAKGGSFNILLGDDPSLLTTTLYTFVKFKAFELTDGSYFYVHYNSYFLQQIEREFKEKISLITANPGFFEDEIAMFSNGFWNITGHNHLPFSTKRRLEKTTPALIVGSGPSLDSAIEVIKQNRENVIVFSCGTGLGALLGHGVTPDFHVELENTPGPLEILSDLANRYDLSTITLVAANTVNPGLPNLFQRRILYFRDSVTATYAFGKEYGAVFNAAPTVSNAAARLAAGLGFRKLYLLGVDLGSREKGKHHSKQSVYCADESFMETHPDHLAASKFRYSARGNFGGTIMTNQSFLWSSTMFQPLKDMFSNLELINCSDGIRIAGAVPQLAETVEFDTPVTRRNRELALVLQEHDSAAGKVPVSLDVVEGIHQRMMDFYEEVGKALEEFEATKDGFFSLYRKLRPLTYDETDSSNMGKVVRQFHIGTIMMFVQIAHIVLRRLPEDARPGYLTFFHKQFETFLAEMRERGLECTGAILAQTRALEKQ